MNDLIINAVIGLAVVLTISIILALALAVANRFFAVSEDPRIAEVIKRLPGYNCGACGYAGCGGMADALVSAKTTKNSCLPAKPEAKEGIKVYLASTPGPDGQTLNTTY